MELWKLKLGDEFSGGEEILARHLQSPCGQYTEHYAAFERGEQVGFLSVDIIPEHEIFIIYEIYVPVRLRRQGWGSRLLDAAERMAVQRGYGLTLLTARTRSNEFSQSDLEAWYRKRGYEGEPNAMSEGTYVKKLTQAAKKQ